MFKQVAQRGVQLYYTQREVDLHKLSNTYLNKARRIGWLLTIVVVQ